MDKSFDDLFNDFFGRKNDDNLNRRRDEISKMFENLANFFESSEGEQFGQMLDSNLGEPDSVENYKEDGLFFQKRTWNTPTGNIVKLLVSDRPHTTPKAPEEAEKAEKSLEIQLEEALANEDFEKAAEIRDALNPPKKKRGRPSKTEKG